MHKRKPLTLREVVRKTVSNVVRKHGGDKKSAAKELGVSLKTIYNILKEVEDGDAPDAD